MAYNIVLAILTSIDFCLRYFFFIHRATVSVEIPVAGTTYLATSKSWRRRGRRAQEEEMLLTFPSWWEKRCPIGWNCLKKHPEGGISIIVAAYPCLQDSFYVRTKWLSILLEHFLSEWLISTVLFKLKMVGLLSNGTYKRYGRPIIPPI